VGHQVEYLIDVLPGAARAWLSELVGWWTEPKSLDVMPYGEFQWGELSLLAELGPKACRIRVPQIKYSWLIAGHAASLESVARLETWLSESLPSVRAVRVDELLRIGWESHTGLEWQQWPDPVGMLRDWLLSSGQDAAYFRLLPNEQR
jgi:hypothetical protein